MTRRQKRFLIGGVVILSLAGGIGLVFHRSTRQALLRAEDFLFRRMQVTRQEDGLYRFFYITNRSPGTFDGDLGERFTNQRADELHFGSYDVEIEPSLGLSSIFNPTKWFRDEEIAVRHERSLSRSELVEQLGSYIRESPHRSLLVIVHGYREQFPSALRKTAFVIHVLDLNSPVLLFDWPGDQGGNPLAAYREAVEIASESGAELAQTLNLVIEEIRPERLWLLANSMGAQVVADAFGLLYQDAEMADPGAELEDVVLTAPDVDLEAFDTRFQREISALTRHLTVYVSSNDRALLASRIVNRGMRRGESTLDTRNVSQDQLEEAIRLAELIEPDSDLIALVDVTPVNRTINFHNFYLESPEVFNDLFLRLVNTETPRHRSLYPYRRETARSTGS